MTTDAEEIEAWEQERRVALVAFCEVVGGADVDLDVDPLAFLPSLEEFFAGQDYASFDEDDWWYLHSIIAAYIAQVFITLHGSRWERVLDERGVNYVLVTRGLDGQEHAVSPMDVVYTELSELHPGVRRTQAVMRMLITAEEASGLHPEY